MGRIKMITSNDNSLLMKPGDDIKPYVTKEKAKQLVEVLYGLKVTDVIELNAYDDKNFHILVSHSSNPFIENVCVNGYVLKVLNSMDSNNLPFVDGQNKLLLFLQDKKMPAPVPVRNAKGEFFSLESISKADGTPTFHIVRLLKFQPGTIFKNVSNCRRLYYDAGVWLANLNSTLKNFNHPVFENHSTIWHLKSVPLLRTYMYVIDDPTLRRTVSQIIQTFIERVLPRTPELEKGLIHGDFNEQNILVQPCDNRSWTISAILDFGDCNFACYLFDIGAAICYMMLEARRNGDNIIEVGGETLRGYQSIKTLTVLEHSLLKIVICSRLCQSLVLGLYSQSMQPDNAYVGDTQANGWSVLSELWEAPDEQLQTAWSATI